MQLVNATKKSTRCAIGLTVIGVHVDCFAET